MVNTSLQTVDLVGSSDTYLREEFRNRLEFLAQLATTNGYELTPYESSELPLFSSLSLEVKIQALKAIDFYVGICQESMAEGENFVTSQQLTWRAMRHFGLLPNQDLIATIGGEDVVEIFDLNNIQLFRNFQFYRFSSYHLEDLYCRPWMDLYRRPDSSVATRLMESLVTALKTNVRSVVELNIGEHIVEEVCSPRMYRILVNVKNGAILYDTHRQPKGFIVVEKVRHLSNA